MKTRYPLRYIFTLLTMLVLSTAACNLGTTQQTVPPTPTAVTQFQDTTSDCLVHIPLSAFVFDAPSFNAIQQAVLESATQVAGLARTENNWFEIEFPEDQRGKWVHGSQINFGNDMQNDQRCQSLPVVVVEVQECIATNITSEVQTIYATSALSEYIGRFHPGNTMPVISQSDNALEVWVGAFARSGWVDANIASLSGDCAGL